MQRTTVFVALAAILGMLAYMVTGMIVMKAYGDEGRPIVLFLLENACSQEDTLTEQFPDAYVYCTHDATVMLARSHLSLFEQMYHVVYINNSPQTWGITMHDYSYSIARPWSVEIRHELEHQYCKCFYTPDGYHGSPKTGTISGVIVS